MPSTIAELLRAATAELSATSPTPRLDADLLLACVLGWPRARLLAERSHQPAPAQADAFAMLVARRAALEPVAYLVGHREFYGLELEVTPAVLVPRPETELLVELAIAEARDRGGAQHVAPLRGDAPLRLTIADIGTGSGAIAIALAAQLPAATIYATDLSAEALAVAARNCARHGLGGRVQLLQGDLMAPLPTRVDIIVSNPPYTILAEVEANVRAHEPHLALDGGPDGADIYRRLIPALAAYLHPGGAALLEIGAWQGEIVTALVHAHYPQARVRLHRDLAGHARVVAVTGL
jgi:release factor glutamine methyltransferase